MGATTDALPATCSGFWPWSLLCRRWLLRTHQPSIGQENQTVENAKLDHLVSHEVAIVLGRQQEQRLPNEPPVDHLGGNQEKTEPENKSLANGEVNSDAGKSEGGHSRVEQGSRSKNRD
jgi:hypothetical protein